MLHVVILLRGLLPFLFFNCLWISVTRSLTLILDFPVNIIEFIIIICERREDDTFEITVIIFLSWLDKQSATLTELAIVYELFLFNLFFSFLFFLLSSFS